MSSAAVPKFPPPPRNPRRTASCDSFPAMTDADRNLLNDVLAAAKGAILESRAQFSALEHRMDHQDSSIAELKATAQRQEQMVGDIRGLRMDVQQLTSTLLDNLSEEAKREREIGTMRSQLASIVTTEGTVAGAKAGSEAGTKRATFITSLVTGTMGVLWIASWIWAQYHGISSPPVIRP